MAHGKSSLLASAWLVVAAIAFRINQKVDTIHKQSARARSGSRKNTMHSRKVIMLSNESILHANVVAGHGRCEECVQKKDSCLPTLDSTSQNHQGNADIYKRRSGPGLLGVMLFGSNALSIKTSLGCFRDAVFSYSCLDCNGDCVQKHPWDDSSTWRRRGIDRNTTAQQARYDKMYFLLANCASKSLFQNTALLSMFPKADPIPIREQWFNLGIDDMMEVDQNVSDAFPSMKATELDQMVKAVREARVKKIATQIKEVRACMAPWMLAESFGQDVMEDLEQLADAFNSARYRVFPDFSWPPRR